MTDLRGQLDSPHLGPNDVVRFAKDITTVVTATPKPPGTRIALHESGAEKPLAEGKVVSVRHPDERLDLWEVDVKLFAPSKRTRTLLVDCAERTANRE